jgi:hypothetical protein
MHSPARENRTRSVKETVVSIRPDRHSSGRAADAACRCVRAFACVCMRACVCVCVCVCVCKLFLSANVSELQGLMQFAVGRSRWVDIIGFMDSLGSVVALVTASQWYSSTGSYVRAWSPPDS